MRETIIIAGFVRNRRCALRFHAAMYASNQLTIEAMSPRPNKKRIAATGTGMFRSAVNPEHPERRIICYGH